jgi:hypothetical protein
VKLEEDRSSLKLFQQKTSLKEILQKPKLKINVEQVEGETPTFRFLLDVFKHEIAKTITPN